MSRNQMSRNQMTATYNGKEVKVDVFKLDGFWTATIRDTDGYPVREVGKYSTKSMAKCAVAWILKGRI